MTENVRIAIIDAVPKIYWGEDEGITDGEKFLDLLSAQNTAAEFDIYYAAEKQLPKNPDAYDGFMISGSPSSANDEEDWIHNLSEFIRRANDNKKRIAASCFGHQLVAKTYGGEVGYNEKGWMIGNYKLEIKKHYDWMQPKVGSTGIYHFNKERVTRLPEQAVSFADSENYADFAYTLGDNILCVQGHPEQPKRAMYNFMISADKIIPEDDKITARRMIENGEPDAAIWGQWMMRFFLS